MGINCALGGNAMLPYVEALSKVADCYIHCYPNAGLPNPLGPDGYDETPEDTAQALATMAELGILNMAGGCCGTTPEHIKAIVDALKSKDHALSLRRSLDSTSVAWNPSPFPEQMLRS